MIMSNDHVKDDFIGLYQDENQGEDKVESLWSQKRI